MMMISPRGSGGRAVVNQYFIVGLQICMFLCVFQIFFHIDSCDWAQPLHPHRTMMETSLQAYSINHIPSQKQQQQQQQERSPIRPPGLIPLRKLVDTKVETSCPPGLLMVNDTILDPYLAYFGNGRPRRIPRIIHVTGKTRCMPQEFKQVLDKWRLSEHSFFFHNEAAVERLIQRDWPEFPQLQQALKCIKGGAAKADVWRALVVWEYGGIYTDMDNAPAKFDEATIQADDDAFFVIERSGILSQYFFAARPRHPLMYLLVQQMMKRLLSLNDISMQIVSYSTGPGALRMAFNNFMDGQGPNAPYESPDGEFWYPKAGVYTGMYNFTVRAVGRKNDPDEYVARDIIPDKQLIYKRMNMTYFRDIPKVETKESCFQRIYKEEGHYDAFQRWELQSIRFD